MLRTVRPTLVFLGALLASGCQMLGIHNMAKAGADHEQVAMEGSAVAPQLQAGRDYLDTNRNGLAIEAFNRALASGEDPAAAYNGLGVAYARIGRDDLAFHFFKKARLSDPENPTYARNLAMFMDSPRFTMALTTLPARPLVARAGLAETPKQVGMLRRDGDRQFTLVSAVPSNATGGDSLLAAFDQFFTIKQTSASRTRLPIVKSRNRASASVPTVAELDVPQKVSPLPLSGPASSPSGKRKLIDLSRMPDSAKELDTAFPAATTANTKS
jgi:Tetratricopeptide repeat